MFHRGILAAAHNHLVVQMGGVIGVGLLTSFRIAPQSFDVFLPLHQRVFAAIRDRKPEAARKAMDGLLAETREFLEGELKRELRRRGKAEAAD